MIAPKTELARVKEAATLIQSKQRGISQQAKFTKLQKAVTLIQSKQRMIGPKSRLSQLHEAQNEKATEFLNSINLDESSVSSSKSSENRSFLGFRF